MKKINLKSLGLGLNDLLSREQMKNVMGGSGGGQLTCIAQCGGYTVTCHGTFANGGCSAADGYGCGGHDSQGDPYQIRC